jgi:hypothetical protein
MIELKGLTKKLKKRSKTHTEQFTCKVQPEVKALEAELNALDWDVPELSRMALREAFEKAMAMEKGLEPELAS